MRVVMGAHDDDIVCVKYSAELSLICTGTSSGELAVWDYEFSRLLDFLIGHTGEITSIQFLWPYPLMLTTSLDSTVCVWKVRNVGENNSYLRMRCLYRFSNYSYDPQRKEVLPTPIYCGQIKMGVMRGIERERY